MNDVVDELRRCGLVLVVVDKPKPRFNNEDGSPMVLAHDEDPLHEMLEWCTMNQVRVTQDPLEPHRAVLIAMTEGWSRSVEVTKAVVRARRARLPLFFLDARSLSLKAA
jgi:hypothetical protein